MKSSLESFAHTGDIFHMKTRIFQYIIYWGLVRSTWNSFLFKYLSYNDTSNNHLYRYIIFQYNHYVEFIMHHIVNIGNVEKLFVWVIYLSKTIDFIQLILWMTAQERRSSLMKWCTIIIFELYETMLFLIAPRYFNPYRMFWKNCYWICTWTIQLGIFNKYIY